MNNSLFTIGHSNHSIENFISLLKKNHVTAVTDVRSQPYCRYHDHFNRESLELHLKQAGIVYVFMGDELGARSKDKSDYRGGKVDFELRAKKAGFQKGLQRVIEGMRKYRIALMCTEKDPLDCHRTILVARNLSRHDIQICHILADGSLENHREAEHRLLEMTDCNQNLFDMLEEKNTNEEEQLENAYRTRCEKISYSENKEPVHL